MSSTDRRTLIAGNWKMHTTRAEARALAEATQAVSSATEHELAIFPPYPWLDLCAGILGGAEGRVRLGAQACHPERGGAFTGAVAASMLAEAGCHFVLCGHSERRHVFGEEDVFVAGSMRAALEAGLTPVLCVGETAEERAAGKTEQVLAHQLDAGLAVLAGPDDPLVLAYEPVWAIGSGNPASPEEADHAHRFLRERVGASAPDRAAALRILYGGSVKAANIGGFLAVPDVDGALIGGAALDPEGFAGIACAQPAGL